MSTVGRRMTHALFAVAAALVGLMAIPEFATERADADESEYSACFAELAPIVNDQEQSDVVQKDCFDDPLEAEAFAQNLHSLDSVYVLFTIWEHSNFGGSSYEWYSTSSCNGDYGYNDFNVIGWNDKAGSARSACGRTVNLWEHTYQMGASLLINGYHSSLGVMNDESSSWDTAN